MKRVVVRMTVEYEVSVPDDWDADMVNFHRNESSWCQDNALEELSSLAPDDKSCALCALNTHFEFVREVQP